MDNDNAGTVDISGMSDSGSEMGVIKGKGPATIAAPDPVAALKQIAAAKGIDLANGSLESMMAQIASAPEPSDTSDGISNLIPPQAEAQPSEAQASEGQTQDEAQKAATQPVAEDKPVSVPEKFQAKDGGIDAEKVAKSTVNAMEALKKYEQLEKDLRKKQAEVNRAKMGLPARAEHENTPATDAANAPSFEKQLEADVQKFGLGTVLARMYEASRQSAIDAIRGQVEEVSEQVRGSRTRAELEVIAKTDPGILTDDGMAELVKVREANPWVNNAESPWSAAHDLLLAQRVKQGRTEGMVRHNPTGNTVKAPATPIGPAPRPVTSVKKGFDEMSRAELNEALRGKDATSLNKILAAQLSKIGPVGFGRL